jgi:hypothetical protein
MRNYPPDSTDDDCERSWSVRQSGQIPVSNVPLYFAPQRRRQCRQTLGNPCRAGRKAGPVVLEGGVIETNHDRLFDDARQTNPAPDRCLSIRSHKRVGSHLIPERANAVVEHRSGVVH